MNGGMASAVTPGRSTRSASSSGRVMWSPEENGSPPPMAAKKMSSWRHSTPLGSPVVPPGVDAVEVAAERAAKSRPSGDWASASSYSGPTPTASAPSATSSTARRSAIEPSAPATDAPKRRWNTRPTSPASA